MILDMVCIVVNGAHIRLSILLGVMMFKIADMIEKPTTNQMAHVDTVFSCGRIMSAFARTIITGMLSISIFRKLTILILGGYLPGYFPPMDAAPHGNPRVRQN